MDSSYNEFMLWIRSLSNKTYVKVWAVQKVYVMQLEGKRWTVSKGLWIVSTSARFCNWVCVLFPFFFKRLRCFTGKTGLNPATMRPVRLNSLLDWNISWNSILIRWEWMLLCWLRVVEELVSGLCHVQLLVGVLKVSWHFYAYLLNNCKKS